MTLAALLGQLRPTGLDGLAFPRHLLGAFRRKSISFCTGVTDETTIVYWFQSGGFSIDLRLPDGADTPVTERQGWIGDTLWDAEAGLLSWKIDQSYQPRNQWPEPAGLRFIGNCVIEFAPSGAYVEDWRQQSSHGPLLGLRLVAMQDGETGETVPMEGGLVVAGDHIACARSRLPLVEATLRGFSDLEEALRAGAITPGEVESYEVSVALGGDRISHGTQPHRRGEPVAPGDFSLRPDGQIAQHRVMHGRPCVMLYRLDLFEPDFAFGLQTPATPEAARWMEREERHLARHAVFTA